METRDKFLANTWHVHRGLMCQEAPREDQAALEKGAGAPEPGGPILRDLILQVRQQTFGGLPGLPESQLSRSQRTLINRWLEGHLRVHHTRRFVRYAHVRSINRHTTRETTGCQEWRNDYWVCDDQPMNVPARQEAGLDPLVSLYHDLGEFMAKRHATATYF